jgi:hypothetical protein
MMVQDERTWNEVLNAHTEEEGFAATAKDPAIYVKGSWTSDDFTAAGFWAGRSPRTRTLIGEATPMIDAQSERTSSRRRRFILIMFQPRTC